MRVIDFLAPDCIIAALQAKSKPAVLTELSDHLSKVVPGVEAEALRRRRQGDGNPCDRSRSRERAGLANPHEKSRQIDQMRARGSIAPTGWTQPFALAPRSGERVKVRGPRPRRCCGAVPLTRRPD